MAMVPTPQHIIRDVAALLQTRGLRYPAHNGAANTDAFKVYAPAIGNSDNLGPASSATTRIVIDITTSVLNDLGETGYGSDNQLPDASRT